MLRGSLQEEHVSLIQMYHMQECNKAIIQWCCYNIVSLVLSCKGLITGGKYVCVKEVYDRLSSL